MAAYSVVLNGVPLAVRDGVIRTSGVFGLLLFGGGDLFAQINLSGSQVMTLTATVGPVILNEAFNGILLSLIMRSADSIVKVFAFSVSIFTTIAGSVALFR